MLNKDRRTSTIQLVGMKPNTLINSLVVDYEEIKTTLTFDTDVKLISILRKFKQTFNQSVEVKILEGKNIDSLLFTPQSKIPFVIPLTNLKRATIHYNHKTNCFYSKNEFNE